MTKIIKPARSGQPVEADQVHDGQSALHALQRVQASGGIRATFSGGTLAISYVGDTQPARYGFMAEISAYDSTEKRYSFTRAAMSGSGTDDGIAAKIEPAGDTKNFADQFTLIEVTGNVSVPIGAIVFAYPLKTTINGIAMYAFAYGARVMYCKVTSADWVTPITGNPCDHAGTNDNTAITVTMSEPYRSTATIFRDVKNDDVIPVIVTGPYAGAGPYTITGDIVSQETTVAAETTKDLDTVATAWTCGATPDGFTETLVSDVSFNSADDKFYSKKRLHTINEAGKVVAVGAEVEEAWALFDPGTGDSSITPITTPTPP